MQSSGSIKEDVVVGASSGSIPEDVVAQTKEDDEISEESYLKDDESE